MISSAACGTASTAAAPAPFDDVRTTIVDNVFNERRLDALNAYLSTLRAEAIIEWKDEGLKTLYTAHIASRTSPPSGF